MDFAYETILVDLDSLLDTRLSLLTNLLDDNDLESVLDVYFNRITNDFSPYITYEDFNTEYLNRTNTVLPNAVMTSVLLMIRDYVNGILSNTHTSTVVTVPKIILNIHPYDLSKDTINHLIKGIIFHTDEKIDITVVSMPDKDITLKYLYANISTYIRYDYYNWLDSLDKDSLSIDDSCPDVQLITPSYLPIKAKDINNIFYKDGQSIDPFNIFSISMRYLINIQFTKRSLFNRMFLDQEDSSNSSMDIASK